MVKSLPIPDDVNRLYPWAKKYQYTDEKGKLLASYVKDENDQWVDNLEEILLKQELERQLKQVEKEIEHYEN